jgi:hypothetical protein
MSWNAQAEISDDDADDKIWIRARVRAPRKPTAGNRRLSRYHAHR